MPFKLLAYLGSHCKCYLSRDFFFFGSIVLMTVLLGFELCFKPPSSLELPENCTPLVLYDVADRSVLIFLLPFSHMLWLLYINYFKA